ncbi:bifunctional glutamate N-acetyltransferase/amino-acid acetyltransferase ArgJ [Rhodopirellula sp. P2]|uniref:bifunctional glutamate N-acetyltransferase/amino-acid acetyltransferase ArgJ n=1 Tax=Rhodopirellula sp. P2 TaxID=2127060 RepID=UPI002368B67A|nr:bifunctional glutamate N-acetyltransferase/amino-acid acetyltransferase ArgJ [Rhodopirellula sp. P2]WDQ15397.1 bifunctional glutamate N-acetyltransferase/amino-acid acetyltransferase ArgJ [Rhodopirellula sp. P2]
MTENAAQNDPPTPPALPQGIRFAGAAGGIKASGKPDVSLIVTDRPAVMAGVYTTNQIVAAPVVLTRSKTPTSTGRVVLTNSGNANACTGEQGMQDAKAMCDFAAELTGCDATDVMVMSTGVIGQPLPMAKVRAGIEIAAGNLGDSEADFLASADAICTTDQFRKTVSQTVTLRGHEYRIAAMCKGAGMIAPNMATMLGVVMTDAPIGPDAAQASLKQIASETFNRVSVDGHTSTNDTVMLVCTGMSESDNAQELSQDELSVWQEAATQVALQLAKMLVADGEGAARFFEVRVSGAANDKDALVIAKTVAASPLVKTAITGGDPNWGRIVSAAGYAGPKIQPERTSLVMDGVTVFENGTPLSIDAAKLSQAMKANSEVLADLKVGDGPGKASFWASDLTEAYVRFNSLYTT